MKTINLTQNKVTLINDIDYDFFCQWNWYYLNSGYAVRKSGGRFNQKLIYMHREIMNAPEGKEVDHINGNRLDNRRENLRIVSRQENRLNHPKRNNKSGYTGVVFIEEKNKYRATITYKNKTRNLGYFSSAQDAGIAYKKEAEILFGEFLRK